MAAVEAPLYISYLTEPVNDVEPFDDVQEAGSWASWIEAEATEKQDEIEKHNTSTSSNVKRDTDGFVIPSLGIGESDQSKPYVPDIESLNSATKAKKEENIYLGPHGVTPSQSKQQELNSSNRKQRFKHKLKEADKSISGTGRENKLDNLRELVGGGKVSVNMTKGSTKDWLDPH